MTVKIHKGVSSFDSVHNNMFSMKFLTFASEILVKTLVKLELHFFAFLIEEEGGCIFAYMQMKTNYG